MGNKHNWTLDFRMNVWCPSPKKSSVALHHPTFGLSMLQRSLSLQGACSLRWISVVDTYCDSHPWIPLGNVSNIQALRRGDFAKHTHCSQRGSCVSPTTGAGRGSAVLQISCPPCRTKGRPSQAACNLHVGADSHMEWPEGRCDRVTFSRYVKLNSRVKLKVPAFPCCLFPSFR